MEHIVVTVVRDEENFISGLIESMVNQTILPKKWIFVDNYSEDGTVEIIRRAVSEFAWIDLIERVGSERRSRGENIAKLFSMGIDSCNENWSYCSKIDADMVLPRDYFEEIFRYFAKERELGIASGTCFLVKKGKKVTERVVDDHTRGGLKTYRFECFSDIDGVPPVDGWDGIDNAKAQMAGWRTRNFSSPMVHHRRETGAQMGRIQSSFEIGARSYFMGYSVLFMAAKCGHQALAMRRPISAFTMILGFSYNVLRRKNKYGESEVIKFIRKNRMNMIRDTIFGRFS